MKALTDWFKRYWLWLVIGLGAAVVIAVPVTAYQLNLRSPNTQATEAIAVSISPGDSTNKIARQLKELGIIRSPWAFQVYVTLNGLRGKIQAGYYELKPSDSAVVNAKIIAHGIVVNKSFLVREGETLQEIADQAAGSWLRGSEMPVALAETYSNEFLKQRPAGSTLEGYLYPDTYVIAPDTTPRQLVQAMLDNFGKKVTPDIVAGFAAKGFSLHQGLTLASIIEAEVAHEADRPIVAQVFLKRLQMGMKLESSPTGIYGAALKGQTATEANVLGVDSPYNTYRVAGLPPGPINNPSVSSMRAVINPASTDYVYFVADKSGNTYFAKTYAEHLANVAQHQ